MGVPSVNDGGGNRAWSNGRTAQCLNVSCTPFPPPERSRAKGKGTITAANGDEATFDVQVHTTGTIAVGSDHVPRPRAGRSPDGTFGRIDAVTCTAGTASAFGPRA